MDGVTVLGQDESDRQWVSNLSGTQYRFEWDKGWLTFKPGGEQWNSYKAGVVTNTVYAHAGERFLPDDGTP